jgi:protein-tyrosine phosphatase
MDDSYSLHPRKMREHFSRFVDIHSHVVPSGDDGAQTVADGRALSREAARHGTAILFATPHVWPHLVLTDEREREVREAYEQVARGAGLELRLGYELTPTAVLLDEDPHRYVLEGTDVVLVEVPFMGAADILVALCEHIEAAGLRPVIAHPERTESVLERPSLARELVERGWQLQANATSLLGKHGPEIEGLGWELIDDGLIAIVASDGHRTTRPPQLDEAYRVVAARVGETRARSLFDGSAVDVSVSERQLPSRAAARGA